MPCIGRSLRRKLAVSSVIGTVLMTTLTITLGSVAVFWAAQTFGIYQGSAGTYFNSRAAALREAFAIEDVWFYTSGTGCSGSCFNLTVRNTGAIEVKIVAIYLNGTSKTPIGGFPSTPIPVGSAATLRVQNSTTAWRTNKQYAYFIQVATARGNQVSTYWSYP